MNRSTILDLVVVLTVVVACWRGWTRKSIREAFALLGFALGVALVVVATGPLAGAIDVMFSGDDNWPRAIAAILLFAVAMIGGTIVGYRIARKTIIPAPPKLDAAGGTAFAFVRILAAAALALVALDTAWGPESVGHRMIADSVSGEVLTSSNSPFGPFYRSLIADTPPLRALASWARQDDVSAVGYQQSTFEATDARLLARADAEREMLRAINADRTERGLSPLAWCATCARVAREHSQDMYRGGYFSHEDLGGNDPFDRMKAARIEYGAAGENLALAPTVAEAHEGLMSSPDHRANILRDEFEQVGIGIYEGPFGLMCTQVFRALP